MSGLPSRVKAVLGPTNTGKTHLAIERLLAHASGIIGFPLRLLARENYDRMVARKGARHVALITGEEKIVPPDARWFSCTVEAMPLDRPETRHVEFLAVDEIQLCADPDRGHVFTDRLLHARGTVETMFLGSDTIRPLLRRLVPQAEIDTRPRMSQLTGAGPTKLVRLPPRSAVVAFSGAEVYAIAEAIRRRRGGCAVVMGRLSPRTRNAQVALYQNKEVDFLVATDAIGMGLNMDVDHVAFARTFKFDGHRSRPLTAAELAQIAGRAGRGMRDGTFGTTATCPPLDDDLVRAVETHSFEPLEQLSWRNSDLDFTSLEALLASLNAPAPFPGLVRGRDATDLLTLAALSGDADIRRLARGRRALHALWSACGIPDFRKFADDTHTRLCARVFTHVLRDGHVPPEWIDGQIESLARTDGDIDTLMSRLSGVRTWSYVAARPGWVKDAAHWQDRARAVEDTLSDALHERLIARFVDRRAASLLRRLEEGDGANLLSAVTARGEVVVEGHPVGTVSGFAFHPDPAATGDEKRMVLRAARRALRMEMPRRVAALEAGPEAAFELRPDGRIAWNGEPVARLRPGPSLLRPAVEVTPSEFIDGPARERIRVRLSRHVDGVIRADLSPLFATPALANPALRGPFHQLAESAGVVAGLDLPPALRPAVKAAGARAGRFALYVPALLKPRPMALRALMWAIAHRVPTPALPAPGIVSLTPPADWPHGFAAAMGWVPAGPVLLRLDVAERAAAELAHATRHGTVLAPVDLASRLSLRADALPAVLGALGVRLRPGAALLPGEYGPPVPAMMSAVPRPRHGPRRRPEPTAARVHRPDSPFAALVALHH